MSLAILKKMQGGMGVHAIQYPTGRWGLAGTVPVSAGYARKDGAPLTADDVEMICHTGSSPHCRTRTYATKEEALAAAGVAK